MGNDYIWSMDNDQNRRIAKPKRGQATFSPEALPFISFAPAKKVACPLFYRSR